MADASHLDLLYFIDKYKYNCPFCNRRHVSYHIDRFRREFDWSDDKKCYVYFVVCDSCKRTSLHLSFTGPGLVDAGGGSQVYRFQQNDDIDAHFFYSVPTSFFVLDKRIPAVIRELITEAEGSRKMNFLTGASACARKAIYEFLVKEKAEGERYEDKIKSLKSRFTNVDPELFDVLGHIQDMTLSLVMSWM